MTSFQKAIFHLSQEVNALVSVLYNMFLLFDILTLIWVGFLGVRFEVGGRGVKLPPLSKTC